VKMNFVALATVMLALTTPFAKASTNVALGAAVTTSGTGFGLSAGWGPGTLAAPSSLTDGVFLPVGTQWDLGTTYWQGQYPIQAMSSISP
jgi:hypothetical protein